MVSPSAETGWLLDRAPWIAHNGRFCRRSGALRMVHQPSICLSSPWGFVCQCAFCPKGRYPEGFDRSIIYSGQSKIYINAIRPDASQHGLSEQEQSAVAHSGLEYGLVLDIPVVLPLLRQMDTSHVLP